MALSVNRTNEESAMTIRQNKINAIRDCRAEGANATERMNQRIYKYPFSVAGEFDLQLPRGSSLLSVQVQAGTPCLWALVDADEPQASRHFRVFGTGHPVPKFSGSFVGTFQLEGGALVFHLFEENP
jgi:hypothetical protein